MNKEERQAKLISELAAHPFLSDQELAHLFTVSIQTIRLDRLALNIPELRKRTKAVAEKTYGLVKSLGSKEIVGELVEIELGKGGLSVLEPTEAMVFERTRIVRGHYIFAQADSLALAMIDADVALTGLANIKFKRPVYVGERLVARADILRRKGNKYVIQVITRSGSEQVFRGKFVVAAINDWEVSSDADSR